ncbi:MAG TPA: fibronectin type III domain-containing protein [Acidimicrobiales bacterium]|nr:fibronectin type III domain-containing protein [Acidimicrobiales bacterium]
MGQGVHSGDDTGFTLLETVIALTVLAVGIVGVVSVFASSFKLTVDNTARSRGTAAASEFVESIRAKPYASVMPDSTTTTTVVTKGGITYRLAGGVTAPAATPDMKQVTVTVSWTDGSGTHQMAQQSYLYPTPASTTTSISGGSAPAAPTSLIATVPTGAQGTTAVDLTWTPPSDPTGITGWVIARSGDNWLTSQIVATTNTPTSYAFRATQLSAGTTYQFRVASASASGLLSAWAPAATATTSAGAAGAPCNVQSATFSPAPVARSLPEPSPLTTAPWLTVETTGSCAGLHAIYHPSPTDTRTVFLVNTTGGTWQAQLLEAPAASWSLGDHEVQVLDQLENPVATAWLRVCEAGSSSC